MDNPLVEAAAISIVVGGLFVVWLFWPSLRSQRSEKSVKPSPKDDPISASTSVKQEEGGQTQKKSFPPSPGMEMEKLPEAETAETDPDTVIIRREKFEKLLTQEREKGMARAFGLLHGAGFLEAIVKEKRLTQAKELVFAGISGRQMTERINPEIRKAETEGESQRPPKPVELRTMTVNGDREIVL